MEGGAESVVQAYNSLTAGKPDPDKRSDLMLEIRKDIANVLADDVEKLR